MARSACPPAGPRIDTRSWDHVHALLTKVSSLSDRMHRRCSVVMNYLRWLVNNGRDEEALEVAANGGSIELYVCSSET